MPPEPLAPRSAWRFATASRLRSPGRGEKVRVLLVAEASSESSRSLFRMLRSRGHDVLAAEGIFEVARLLASFKPDVVIVEDEITNGGAEAAGLIRRGGARVVIFGDAEAPDELARSLEVGPKEGHALSGTLGPFGVLDVVQFLVLSGANGCLSIGDPKEGSRLYFEQGTVVAAFGPEGDGEAVFLDAARAASGAFHFEPGVVAVVRNVTRSTNALLLDAARALDERCVHAA